MSSRKLHGSNTMENLTLALDVSALEGKLERLLELLKTSFPEGVSGQFVGELLSKLHNVILSDGGSTSSTDGSRKVLVTLDFDSSFESLVAALRARDVDFVLQDNDQPLAVLVKYRKFMEMQQQLMSVLNTYIAHR
jgi:hypothetical protein